MKFDGNGISYTTTSHEIRENRHNHDNRAAKSKNRAETAWPISALPRLDMRDGTIGKPAHVGARIGKRLSQRR